MDTSYEREEEEEEAAAPLVSISGIPTAVRDTRQPYERQRAVYMILASTLLERIAFYTLAANISLNLESVKDSGNFSIGSIASFIFSGTSYISTLIFAILSDWRLGRGKTIIIGFVIYLIGYLSAILIMIAIIQGWITTILNGTGVPANDSDDTTGSYIWMIGTVIIIAVGAGAVEANMAVFGAEQIQTSKITSRYFDKYMIAINVGGIIATVTVRSIYKSLLSESVGNRYLLPCIVAASILFLAALLFIIGWRYYIHVDPHDTVITNCFPVILNAFQSWRAYNKNNHSADNQTINSTTSNLFNASHSFNDEDKPIILDQRPSSFLDFAKAANNGKFPDRIVNDVKSLRGVLVVFILLIPYWLVYTQLSSTFPVQATYMRDETDTKITFMWLGDPVTIIIGISIFNLFVYKCLDIRHKSLTIANKFVIGMCFSIATMCIAGTLEVFRQKGCDINNCNIDNCSNKSDVIIYAQLPQNIFMGFSEIFAMLASFEFAYFAAPRSAQTLFMSLRFCSMGVASFIGAAYFTMFSLMSPNSKTKTSDKIERSFFECPMETSGNWIFYTYFFVLAGLQLIFVIIFIVCQRKYQIIKMNPQQMETNQFLRHASKSASNRQ